MSTNHDNDRELWRRLAPRPPSEEAPPDANLLAAWLEGKAAPAEAEQVERALAADPDLLETVADLRAAHEAEAPSAVLERARALVPDAKPRATKRVFFLNNRMWHAVAAAVAILVTAPIAYRLGRVTARQRSRPVVPNEVRAVFSQDDTGGVAGLLNRARKGGRRS